jgi:PAS domain S-box-containing protein
LEEALRDFPNNPKFSDEFAYFLCEGKADYDKAIKQKYRSEMVSNGVNFSVDLPFKILVRSFPEYLKEGIMDTQGNFIKAISTRRGSQISSVTNISSAGYSTTSSSSIEIDAALEQSIAKQLFSQSKMRLALQKSIDSKQPAPVRVLLTASIVCIFILIVITGATTDFITREFSYQRDSAKRSSLFTLMSSDNNLIMASLLLRYANAINLLDEIPTFSEDPEGTPNVFDLAKLGDTIDHYITDQSSSFLNFLESIAIMSSNGYDVYTIAASILTQINRYSFCYRINGSTESNNPISTNFKNIQAYHIYAQKKMNDLADLTKLFIEEEYCALTTNIKEYSNARVSIFETFSGRQVTNSQEVGKNVTVYSIINIVAAFLLSFIINITIYVVHLWKVNRLIKALTNIDSEAKQNAMNPVVNGLEDENDKVSETSSPTSTCAFVIIANLIFCDIFVVLVVLMMDEANSAVQDISNINTWIVQSAFRTASTINAFAGITGAIILGQVKVNYTDQKVYLGLTDIALKKLNSANSILLDGSKSVPSVFGFDKIIDELNIKDTCTTNSTDSHGIYMCMSTSKQFSIFKDFVAHIKSHIDEFVDLNNATTLHMIHLVSSHLLQNLYKTDQRLSEVSEKVYLEMRRKLLLYFVICLFISIIFLPFVAVYVTFTMKSHFNSLMILIKRLSPLDVISNKKIMDFLLNRSVENKENGMGIAHSVIRNSIEAVFGTGLNGIIEIVNPAVSETFGYTPEQLLGQPIYMIFTDTDVPDVTKKMEMMKKGECSTVIEERVTCIADNSSVVTCRMLMIGMQKDAASSISSFVFILRNESDLIRQQKELEKAKASSEKLLFQILPRDIVVRLNSGEKDISFTVPSASIIFIDIVKFSEYTLNLTPQEIMGNLSMIFETYDQLISKYQQLTKIKLIGDVYMAAGGLFAPKDQEAKVHAEEAVKFCIDCLHDLEEINVKLNASLNVRIGINTGGPIIAGVLGTDRPVFDIIGDPINTAARLQSTDIPGRIQISQETKDCINEFDFKIEPRGEVYLKGKGKSMTYFVSKVSNLLMLST